MNQHYSGISIVLPALNEEQNLEELSKEIMEYFEHRGTSYELIIVDDGSTDETAKIADDLTQKFPNVVAIHHSCNSGYGKSLRDGFEKSRYNYLFFTDADRQFRIKSFDSFFPLLKEGNLDMIIGYRIDRKDSRLRIFLAWCFNKIVRTLFSLNYRDVDCAFKLFKKDVFTSLELTSEDFLFNAELLAKAQLKNYTIVQLGVEHYPRSGGKSTVSYSFIFLTLKRLFALYQEVRRFKGTLN
jgi:glycosyltransferase involved in cell wall biosynthesis